MKKFAIATLILAALAFLYAKLKTDSPPTVALAAVETGLVQATVSNTRAGTVKACRRSKLSMPIGGRVSRLFVTEGDAVKENQTLLELWNDDRRARTDQAQATLHSANLKAKQQCLTADFDRRESKRLDALAKRNLASEESVDNAKTKADISALACKASAADQEVAQANVALQQALLELTLLKAPFDGVIAEINGEVGEYVTPSPPGVATPPAVDLIDTGCLYVTAPIDEVDAMPLQVGLPANITLDAFGDRVFQGTLSRIAPYVLDKEKQARTVDIDVQFAPPPKDVSLLIGYSADISIILESRDKVLRIPAEAVIEGNHVLVYNAESGTLEKRNFNPGISNWNHTEVVDGLSSGERIALSLDTPGIEDGATVMPADDGSDK